uniref:GH26 domain-containing protein n=1 Tax=Arcella intermedia TaxID=1963864 RepID=A0A6B2L8Q7_9EUKA
MEELKDYLVVVSWWGQTTGDGEGMKTNQLMHQIFASAQKFGTQIAIHLEPYEGRSEKSVKSDIQYLIDSYGKYTSFARLNSKPILYIYDSYLTPANDWSTILSPTGENTIRGTLYDAVVLGLYLRGESKQHIKESHMDGFYTYFAAEGFTEGATPAYWNEIVRWGNENDLLSSISVGPGYDDTRIRPWNAANKKERNHGEYYNRMWETAIQSAPSFISVTSYNEWMEGTQIESAKPMEIPDSIINKHQPYSYDDYSPHNPDYYIQLTTYWARKFALK